jgi:mRNA interferase MazF
MDWKMNNQNHQPRQSEIWLFNPDPVVGNELGYKSRPALIISNNMVNQGPSNLVIIVPCTSKNKNVPSHIRIEPPNGGVNTISLAVCEQVRSISKERLIKKFGSVDAHTLKEVLAWVGYFTRFDGA